MATRRRIKDHKQRGMNRRMQSGRKPMSPEQKEDRKKLIEVQRASNLKRLANKK